MTRVARWLQVRPGEGALVALLTAQTLLLAAASSLAASALDALLLVRLGVRLLPFLYVAAGLIGMVTALAVSAALSRGNRGRFYSRLCGVLALLLAGDRLLVGGTLPGLLPVAWLAVSAIAGLQGLIGWGLAGLVCDTRQAKRLFPLFASGGVLGAVGAGLLTHALALAIGTENVLLVSALATAAGWALGRRLVRKVPREAPPERNRSLLDDARRGAVTTRGSPMLRWLLVASVLFSVLYFVLAYPFSRAAAATYAEPAALAGFLGTFQAVATGAAFLLSAFASSRIYSRVGLMGSILVLPAIYLAGFGLLLAAPGFPVLVAFRTVQTAWLSGVAGTAYHALFNVVPGDRRDQSRSFVDGIGTQVGTVIGGGALALGQLAIPDRFLYLFGAFCAALTLVVMVLARRAYGPAVMAALRSGQPDLFGPSNGARRLAGDPALTRVAESALAGSEPALRRLGAQLLVRAGTPAGLEVLRSLADDPDPHVRVVALARIGRLPTTELSDPDPGVRVAAVESLAGAGGAAAEWAEMAIRDPAARVRRAAIAVLPSIAPQSAVAILPPLLADRHPGIAGAAAAALAEVGAIALPALLASLAVPRREAAALSGLEKAHLDESAVGMLGAHAGTRAAEALRLFSLAACPLPSQDPVSGLLAGTLVDRARRTSILALRAWALGRDSGYARVAARGLSRGTPEQRANALEMLDSMGPPAALRSLLVLLDGGEVAEVRPGRLEDLLGDADAFTRTCAELVHSHAGTYSGGDPVKTLDTLPLIERVLFLKGVGIFADLDPDDLGDLAAVAEERTYADGECLGRQGEPGNELFVIATGSVEVVKDGRERYLREVGEVVGEMALLTGAPRSADLFARGESRVLCLDQLHFASAIAERPEISLAVIRVLCRRVAERQA